MPISVPANYKSPDVIDRRSGEKPSLADKARDIAIKVRTDYNDSFPSKTDPIAGPASKPLKLNGVKIPSYKKGGKVRKTGLAYVHKGETITPAGKNNEKKRGIKRG